MTHKSLRPIERVMLIFPPMFDTIYVDTMYCPPMGIAYLGAFVRDMVDVKLLDALIEGRHRKEMITDIIELNGLSYDEIVNRIRDYKPDMVGFSCIFSGQIAGIREIARRVRKEVDPDTVLVAGGTHPSFLPERTLENTELDYIVLGEGELTFRDIIQAHNRGHGIEEIDGLAYRANGTVQVNPRINYVEDLDDLPLPARDLLPMEEYFKANVPMGLHWRKRRNTPIITSRGCPHRCAFCSSHIHWGDRYRPRTPGSVLDEIEHLKSVYNVQELKFQDDNLTIPRARAQAIFEGMIERGLVMPWNTPNGVAIWTLDEELIKLMKKSGCFEFTLAIESGDPWVLKNIVKKPLKLEKAVEIARLARKYKISTTGYFIIGFPGETREQIQTTLDFALKIGIDHIAPFIYNPLPGSELWKVCIEKGYISKDYRYEDANNYFQSDLITENFDADELLKAQARTYLKNLVKMPFRNPREFFSYYSRLALTRPDFLRTFINNSLKSVKKALPVSLRP